MPNSERLGVLNAGLYCASLAFVGTFGFSVAQILQILGMVRFPVDAILIYGFSLCIATPFVLANIALHYCLGGEKRFWSHAAIVLSTIYATYVGLNYVVQLATVIPIAIRGPLGNMAILDQTPHSLFWDVDALGYIYFGLATLFAAQVFAKQGLQAWVRGFFIANGLVVPLIGLVYFYPKFSTGLLLLGLPWVITANGSTLLLAVFFKQQSERHTTGH